jgi:hypothetical protein
VEALRHNGFRELAEYCQEFAGKKSGKIPAKALS